MSEPFEPRIVAFMCNWCSYAGADNAGIARMPSPANVLPIRVMCSGRVSPEMSRRARRAGDNGVRVLGCHRDECNEISGNHRTAKRVPLLRNLLGYVGINPNRLRLDWVSSAEAPKFAQVTREFVETVRALWPIAEEVRE